MEDNAIEPNPRDDFFKKSSNGGTYISSGLLKALDIIEKRYSPNSWNVYSFHCSDGENWQEDNDKAFQGMQNLIDISQLSGYIQIKEPGSKIWGTEMAKIFEPLVCEKFKVKIIYFSTSTFNLVTLTFSILSSLHIKLILGNICIDNSI